MSETTNNPTTVIRGLIACCRLMLDTLEGMVGNPDPCPPPPPPQPPLPGMSDGGALAGASPPSPSVPRRAARASAGAEPAADQWQKLDSWKHKCVRCGTVVHPRFKAKHICKGEEAEHRELPMQRATPNIGAPALEPAERSTPAEVRVAPISGPAKKRMKGGLE